MKVMQMDVLKCVPKLGSDDDDNKKRWMRMKMRRQEMFVPIVGDEQFNVSLTGVLFDE